MRTLTIAALAAALAALAPADITGAPRSAAHFAPALNPPGEHRKMQKSWRYVRQAGTLETAPPMMPKSAFARGRT